MTDRELMQMALDALESVFEGDDKGAEYWTVNGGTYEAVECMNAMRALRAALAQPEPVAWMDSDGFPWTKQGVECRTTPDTYTPLYTATPQREWKSITGDEIWDEWCEQAKPERNTRNFVAAFARAIEAKLKAKNA